MHKRSRERDAVKEDDDLFNARSGNGGGGGEGASIEKKAPSFYDFCFFPHPPLQHRLLLLHFVFPHPLKGTRCNQRRNCGD